MNGQYLFLCVCDIETLVHTDFQKLYFGRIVRYKKYFETGTSRKRPMHFSVKIGLWRYEYPCIKKLQLKNY